jgi:hypothetical protein
MQFYRRRCAVCERSLPPGPANRVICRSRRCKAELRRFPHVYQWPIPVQTGRGSKTVERSSKSAGKPGTKNGIKNGLGWRQVAGPELSVITFRLASIPLEPDIAARLDRAHADYFERQRRARRRAQLRAIIKRHHLPLNVLGGYRFPGTPPVDLSPIEASTPVWATASRWRPCMTPAADFPDLPDFLERRALPLRRAA